jgi:hypothetical protein
MRGKALAQPVVGESDGAQIAAKITITPLAASVL